MCFPEEASSTAEKSNEEHLTFRGNTDQRVIHKPESGLSYDAFKKNKSISMLQFPRSVLFPACSHSVLPKRLSVYFQGPHQQTAAPPAGDGKPLKALDSVKKQLTLWLVNCIIFCFQVIVIQIMVAIVQQVQYSCREVVF